MNPDLVQFVGDKGQKTNGSRKRVRTLKSCLLCRQKKTKCDKLKPVCGGCKLKGRPELCHYEESRWSINITTEPELSDSHQVSSQHNQDTNGLTTKRTYTSKEPLIIKESVSNNDQLLEMNQRIRQLEAVLKKNSTSSNSPTSNISPLAVTSGFIASPTESNDFIDFYQNSFSSPVKLSSGTLSWVSLLKKDVYLNAIVRTTKYSKAFYKKTKKSDEVKNQKFMKKYFKEHLNSEVNEEPTCPVEKRLGLIDQLKASLKDSKLIWLSVERFFDSECYATFPFLDRTDFTSQLVEIVGAKGQTEITLNLHGLAELTTVGILLIIIRISSLSLYSFGRKPVFRNEADRYIHEHPPSYDCASLMSRCSKQITSRREAKLPTLQFLMMMAFYGFYAPEECDCVSFADPGTIAQLANYATRCGLNRDPLTTSEVYREKNENLLRRLWYEIVFLDFYQLLSIGCPPTIDDRFFDTKLPKLEDSENHYEFLINKSYESKERLKHKYQPLLMAILNVRDRPKIEQVLQLLEPLLEQIKSLRPLKDIFNSPSDTVEQRTSKIREHCIWINAYSLLYMIYYHFYLFHNERNNKNDSIQYLCRIVNISSILYENILALELNDGKNEFYDLQKQFGSGFLIFPKIELVLHRIVQMMLGILPRIKALKAFSSGLSEETTLIIDEMLDIIKKVTTNIITKFVRISDTYYHPWVVSKLHAFMLNEILAVPKGPNYKTTTTELDIQFLKSLNGVRNHDSMFERYTTSDLTLLLKEFRRFEVYYDEFKGGEPSSDPDMINFDADMITENDKRWLDQMVHDYMDGVKPTGDSETMSDQNLGDVNPQSCLNNFSPWSIPEVNSNAPMTTNNSLSAASIPSSIDDNFVNNSNVVPNGNTGDKPILLNDSNTVSLNDILNGNIDLLKFDKVFSGGWMQ